MKNEHEHTKRTLARALITLTDDATGDLVNASDIGDDAAWLLKDRRACEPADLVAFAGLLAQIADAAVHRVEMYAHDHADGKPDTRAEEAAHRVSKAARAIRTAVHLLAEAETDLR